MEFPYGPASGLGSLTLVTFMSTLIPLVDGAKCQPGLLLPVWMPQENLFPGEAITRGIAYFLVMLHLFLGVSIVSDKFMGAIEVITSKKAEVKVKMPNGETKIIVVNIWNQTVANLTLMALGSSAPEILLSIIEIIGKNFDAGELGPGTIVGSAAFNLLIIIAICVYVIPEGEVRRIKHLRVFFVTATWSVFAYIWLLIILKVTSPGIVDIWEGLLTFLFFPATVGTAYIADRRLLGYKYLSKTYRLNKRGQIVEGEGTAELEIESETGLKVFEEEELDEEIREFEQNRRDYIQTLRDLRKRYPNLETEALETMAREEILNKAPKSRAFYRMQATRKLLAGQDLVQKVHRASLEAMEQTVVVGGEDKAPSFMTTIFFDPAHYTVRESVGTFEVTVARQGGDMNQTVLVDYKSEDGTATAKADYTPVNGTLTFGPGETHKEISIQVLDDDIFEEDEHFYIRLSDARFAHGNGGWRMYGGPRNPAAKELQVQLVNPFLATVMILDDDHSGIFNILDPEIETVETIGYLDVTVIRHVGARGKVLISYTTLEGTAKPGKDFEPTVGKLLFENAETEKVITIPIMDEDSYEKDVLFYLEISNPVPLDDHDVPLEVSKKSVMGEMTKDEIIAMVGWPKIGQDNRAQIRVKENKEFKNSVDKLLQRTLATFLVGTSSWKEQFVEAITVNAGGDDGEEDDEKKNPSFGDYFMHFLTIFWKVLFATIPPASLFGGYLTFVVSIGLIGVLTALIGDVAAHFGCSVGLQDSVTAIVFVALGTSIPDTFASMVAAVQDEYADASVGNVTGSNAVNVFLGIGIAWTIAAIAHQMQTCTAANPDCKTFKVDPGSLGFSVTLFCACAVVAIAIMLIRRLKVLGGGELGGPSRYKYSTAILFVTLWIFYALMSSLETYGKVQGF